ncbi:HTH domain-containing protein, partial [Clostridium perfringens]|uniref:HTH domain-containing protein n=1 Tax=Clostridium perfringens TaxID=1502 RepID=UPI00325A7D11
MEELRDNKVNRILSIFEKLKDREGVNAQKAAQEFGVNEKTIKRDINDIRAYIDNRNYNNLSIVYKRSEKDENYIEAFFRFIKLRLVYIKGCTHV